MRAVVLAAVLLAIPTVALAGDGGAGTVPGPSEVGPATGKKLDVGVGREVVVDAPGVSRVSIGDPSVADVAVVSTHEVLVTGLAEGRTSLILWLKSGRQTTRTVVVTDTGPLADAKAAARVLGLDKVLVLRAAGSHVVVDGKLSTIDQLRRFDQFRRSLSGLVILVKVDPGLYQRLADRITKALHDRGIRTAHATAIGTTIFLEGTVTDEAERERAADIAQAIWGQVKAGRLEDR